MARGWIAAINTFLEHHNNRPNVEHSAIQKAFKGMTLALEEIEEQKNLISADIIMVSWPHSLLAAREPRDTDSAADRRRSCTLWSSGLQMHV